MSSSSDKQKAEVDFSRNLDGSPIDLTPDQVSHAYDGIHARGAMQSVPGYYRWLLSLAAPAPKGRLLDVGCGTGVLLGEAAAAGLTVAGLDISPVGIEKARQLVPAADLRVGVAEELPFPDSSFDAVTCCGSLEHVADPPKAVQEMRRVARPGAPVLIVVPNSHYIWAWIIHIRQRFFRSSGQPVERHATHRQWEKLLADNGLRVRAVYKDNLSYVPTRVLQALGAVAAKLTPFAISYQYIFIAEPDKPA